MCNHALNRSMHQQMNIYMNQSIHPFNQSINPSIHQSINQSISQSINQSVNQSVTQSVCQPIRDQKSVIQQSLLDFWRKQGFFLYLVKHSFLSSSCNTRALAYVHLFSHLVPPFSTYLFWSCHF